MKLIVGLGNPGEKYKDTRHNVGFLVVDKLAHELGSSETKWSLSEKHKAEIAKTGDLILVKPQTFMNASGASVAALVSYYHLKPSDVWVIHDDLDLPLGKIRIRVGGASAGHHGVDSIIEALKTDTFTRFRLGIGPGKEAIEKNSDQHLHRRNVIDFVLSRFTQSEAGELKHIVKHGAEAVRTALMDGMDKAMNRFN
jgi:PTH1 family peptidyl-tRNA hydrolase